MFRLKRFPLFGLFGTIILILCLMPPVRAQQARGAPITQRRINEWAAALQRARFAVVEDSGYRLPNETLNHYLQRMAQSLPGESPATYRRRIDRYIDAFSAAADATSAGRQIPVLQDSGTANLKLWRQAVTALERLPERVRRLRLALKAIQTPQESRGAGRLSSELTDAMAITLSAYSALRDVRP